MVEVWKPKIGNHFYRLVKADSVEHATKKAEKVFNFMLYRSHFILKKPFWLSSRND
jgi:hypothetical protein